MIQDNSGHENLFRAHLARFLYEDSPLLFADSFSPSPSVGVSERRKSLGARKERGRKRGAAAAASSSLPFLPSFFLTAHAAFSDLNSAPP